MTEPLVQPEFLKTWKFLPRFGANPPKTTWVKQWQHKLEPKKMQHLGGATLSSLCIPWGIFTLPHSPALLSITRNSAPQLKSLKLSLKQLQNNPDLVGSVRLSSQERSVLWETSLSWDVSHGRLSSLSQEAIAGKYASLLLLKLVLFFPPKVLWPGGPPHCVPSLWHTAPTAGYAHRTGTRGAATTLHIWTCTSVHRGLAKESVSLGC